MKDKFIKHPSSFRDPSGYLFYYKGVLYRQINKPYKNDFEQFISGGLYQNLVEKKVLIPHKTINENLTGDDDWYLTIQPELIPFISYPYEWCFNMLKDAALLTLEVAREALNYNMLLKDASAYNLQFHNGRIIFIDSLSLTKYDAQKPWIAYRQFCEQFLAPLALMHYLKAPLQSLMLSNPQGLPLHLTSKMLPFKSKLNLNTYLHLHLQPKLAKRKNFTAKGSNSFSIQKLNHLLMSLEDTIKSFSYNEPSSIWSGYYDEACQRENYIVIKKQILSDWLKKLPINSAIDIGSNEGAFSSILSEHHIFTISADQDHYSVNNIYNEIREKAIVNIHPLVMNFENPTPAIGVNNEERESFINRAHADLVLALAVIHHLTIAHNIPFEKIAKMFKSLGSLLMIEFIPREDNKVKSMLTQMENANDWYSLENFLLAFSTYYELKDSKEISNSGRILYLMKAHE